MNEKNIIKKIAEILPRSALQMNGLFESDAEILREGGDYRLFTIDEFSHEDRFYEKDGYLLGWNVAAGTMSDVAASGGATQYFGCSLTVNKQFGERFTLDFTRGMADVLKAENAAFIGGDFGRAKEWRAACFAVGATEKPVLRSGAKAGDHIYLTGALGAGALQAIGKPCKFQTRKLPEGATAAVDTSDGAWNGLCEIAAQSGAGFEIFDVPYLLAGLEACRKWRLPKEFLFFCECGEYELLFTSPLELPYLKIGEITPSGKRLRGRDVSGFGVRARDYKNAIQYVWAVKRRCERLL
jgi:thiamine-monophosphate kinase